MATMLQELGQSQPPMDDQHPGDDHNNNNISNDDGGKRKRGNDGGGQRTKRNRYISLACNECKRRKIKCNGEHPCQRCGNLNLECIYAPNCCGNTFKDSPEYKQMSSEIGMLQQQVQGLIQELFAVRRELGHEVPTPQMYQQSLPEQLQAPQAAMLHDADMQGGSRNNQYTESAGGTYFAAQGSMNEVGMAQDGLDSLVAHAQQAQQAQQAQHIRGDSPRIDPAILHSSKDPIWAFNVDDALRLCRVFEDEIGSMYPILNNEQLSRKTTLLFKFMEAGTKSGIFQRTSPGMDAMYDEDTDIIKLVFANAMLSEGHGSSELAKKLFDSVQRSGEQRSDGTPNLKSIRISTLSAIFHFLSDNELLAWRVIGLAARLCVEMGLHRAETYEKRLPEEERSEANMLFWSVYVLDRRWSFGTGLPFALPGETIDPRLPKPSESSPYLAAMINLSDIGSKVWKATHTPGSNAEIVPTPSSDEMGYLDYQLSQWHNTLPEVLRFTEASKAPPKSVAERAAHRYQLLLLLRRNQMRIMIYRPVLQSATLATALTEAQLVVEVAKESIRLLTHIDQTSDIYRTSQMTFNHFLISALGVLFLAASNSPAQFANNCRNEFYQALDLVKNLSEDSFVSKRLWTTIRGLKDVAPKMGLLDVEASANAIANATGGDRAHEQQYPHDDAHSSAAMGLAGLAGHPVDESVFFAQQLSGQAPDMRSVQGVELSADPTGMANELINLYESGELGVGLNWGGEEQVGRLMRDLF